MATSEKAEFYRKSLREVYASDGVVDDDAIVRLTTRALDDPTLSPSPNSVAFHSLVLLLFGDPSHLRQLLFTLIAHPEIVRQKPYAAVHGALRAVLPIPDQLQDPDPRAAAGWCLERAGALSWDPRLAVYQLCPPP